jgi:hypothetical protein
MAGSPESHEREGLSDALTIPRMIKVLSEGFDPARRLLLFCESANLRLYAPADGSGAIAESGKKFNGINEWSCLD